MIKVETLLEAIQTGIFRANKILHPHHKIYTLNVYCSLSSIFSIVMRLQTVLHLVVREDDDVDGHCNYGK